jgi:hypothetical protein
MVNYNYTIDLTWFKWLRMKGHCLHATLEVTGLNPGRGKINSTTKIEKMGFLTLKKFTPR